ncbi:hypothetical protein Tco_1078007, partial [Tanacetum coccineum]
ENSTNGKCLSQLLSKSITHARNMSSMVVSSSRFDHPSVGGQALADIGGDLSLHVWPPIELLQVLVHFVGSRLN